MRAGPAQPSAPPSGSDSRLKPVVGMTMLGMTAAEDGAAETWDDGWTVVTCDGSRSAQYEHTVLITKDGCEVLTVPD